jgi:iron complex outermembrane recepter protein
MDVPVEPAYSKLLFACIAGMTATAAHANESSPDAAAEGLPEIIVTARRRDEDAQLVPIAMTTLSGDSFANSGRVRLEELNQSLPSTNIQFSGPRQTSIVVRGIGNNPGNDSLESSVGVYLDNVYLGRASMANLDLVDLEQVAMLRGPQGTLFGKNTTAGVLAIATRPPSFVRGGTLESSVGNYDSYQIKATWSQPLREDELAARLSFARSVRGGFISDVTTGHELNESDRTGGRAQVLWQPGEIFSVRTIVDYSEEHSDAGAFALWNPGPNNGSKYYSAVARPAQASSTIPTTMSSRSMAASTTISARVAHPPKLAGISAATHSRPSAPIARGGSCPAPTPTTPIGMPSGWPARMWMTISGRRSCG